MVVGASFDVEGVSNVDTDNRDIARQAVHHLAALGHRRIGFVGGTGEVANDRDRREGFIEALAQHRLSPDPAHLIAGSGWRLDDGARLALESLLRSADRPTAIFAAGYYFALDVYTAAQAAGLKVGTDLSVVGVDDPPSAAHLDPGLTTLRQPLTQLGRLAARHLFDQIGEAKPTVQRTTLRAELVARESASPCRRA
jgi:DNA-binding LacI/PurR family transcriptional regulator